MNLGPTDFSVEVPDEIPGLARDEGIPHGHSPVSKALEAVLRGVLDGVGQRHADLTVGVDGVGNNHAVVSGEVDWGAVTPQFFGWCEGDAITFTMTLLEGQAKPEFHGLVGREIFTVHGADVLRTDFPRRDRPGSARRRCRRRVGALGGSSCHPREPEDHS